MTWPGRLDFKRECTARAASIPRLGRVSVTSIVYLAYILPVCARVPSIMAGLARRDVAEAMRRVARAGSWPRLAGIVLDGHAGSARDSCTRASPSETSTSCTTHPWGHRDRRWYSGGHPFQTPLWNEEKRETGGDQDTPSSRQGPRNRQSVYQKYVQPYMQLSRVDKPIGTWLLLWPSWWSICLAAPQGGPVDLATLGMFGSGAFLLRGAGCTVNDMWDRDYDRQVERTKNRPLASGALTQRQALGWLALQLSGGLAILLHLPPTSQVIGVASLPFVVAYPLMKRWTGWPQAFLGLTINWGAMMGWAAVCDAVTWSVVGPLYASGFFWTLIYDTVYAHQDKTDDIKVGVKSTALTFGNRTKTYLTGFAVANILSMTAAGVMAGCHGPFYGGVAAAAAHLAWQVRTVDLDKPQDCMDKFKSNWWYGFAIWSGIVADKMFWV